MNRFKTILTTIASGLFATNTMAAPLAEGTELPRASQKNQAGQVVDLAKSGAFGYLLVYFYPKADTPGCTKQACSLRDSYAILSKKGVKIFGVSMDTVDAQKAFHEKFKLPFDLLADKDATIVNAFGVSHKMGFAKRQAFLFKDGKLVWRDLSASTAEQAADVLKVIDPDTQSDAPAK